MLRFRWKPGPGSVFADSDERRPEGPESGGLTELTGSSTSVEEAGEMLAPVACAEAMAVSSWSGYGRDEVEGKWACSELPAMLEAADNRDLTLLGVEWRCGLL